LGDGHHDQGDAEPGPVASSTSDATVRDAGGMLAFRSVQQSNHCAREEFLYELKAGPADGRLRRPSSRRQRRGGYRGAGLTLKPGWCPKRRGRSPLPPRRPLSIAMGTDQLTRLM
jgi:hypothetical protein